MAKSSYEVYKKDLKELDFEILVLKIPKDEIEDKLAYLAREKGNISRSFFEDFIISTCIANINQLLSFVRGQFAEQPDLMKVRAEIMDAVNEINPLLAPENLIINRNYVIKLKNLKTSPKKGEKLLTDNKSWTLSYYNDFISETQKDQTTPKDTSDGSKKDINKAKKIAENEKSDVKDISELEYEVLEQWWKRLNQYINIKRYKESDFEGILKKRFFHNRSSFQTFIVSICVLDFEDLFSRLDDLGIPQRVAPPILMNEIYKLCEKVNPFLTYEKAQDLATEDFEDEDQQHNENRKSGSPNRMASAMSDQYGKKGKKKKSFRDVPKEDLLTLADKMKVFVVGQDEAVDSLVESIQRASVGLKDPIKPIGSFLFAGRTGVGKTLASKVLADELIKDRNNIITIDCSEYSSDHEYSKLIGCFVSGTKILMTGGRVKNIENVKIGEEVITHKGRKRKVRHVHEYKQNGDMIKFVTVNSNIPVTTTKTHEILAIKGEKCSYTHRKHVVCKPSCSKEDCSFKLYEKYTPKWIPASKLEVGDILLYPRYKSTGKYPVRLDLADYIKNETRYKYDDKYIWAQKHIKIPRYIEVGKDLMRLAGYYVSEGGVGGSGKALNFTFNSKEIDYVTEIVKLIRRLFGKEVRIRIQDRSERHSHRIWISSKIICNFMSELFGHNTYVKRIPEWFCELSDNLIKQFLETAVFGDGCLTIQRRMDYSTVSSALFYQMELLFRQLGYITYKQLEPHSKLNHNWSDRYRLYISGNQIEKLNEEFNFNLNLAGMVQTNIQRLAWMDDDYLYLQIKKIDYVNYIGKVYDLAVKDDVSYVTEIIVHNSPHGYIGHEQGGALTNAVMKTPFSVVVFDEIEKASNKVHELLLQVLEEGRLTDGKGTRVSFKNTIVIMTSNIGVAEIENIKKTIGFGDVAKVTNEKKDKALTEALKKKFKPEFLNRIDTTINFKTLKKIDYMRIIDIELYKLNDNLKINNTEYKNIELKFDDKVKKFIYKYGIDEDFGARPLKRYIEKNIGTPLANKLLKEDIDTDSVINMSVRRNKVVMDAVQKIEEAPFYIAEDYQNNKILSAGK